MKQKEDLADLESLRASLTEALREAVIRADPEAMVSLQSELKGIPLKIFAAEVADCRNQIQTIDARLPVIKIEWNEAEEVRTERQAVYAEKLIELEPFAFAVKEAELAQYRLQTEGENLREARRDLRKRLDELLASQEMDLGLGN